MKLILRMLIDITAPQLITEKVFQSLKELEELRDLEKLRKTADPKQIWASFQASRNIPFGLYIKNEENTISEPFELVLFNSYEGIIIGQVRFYYDLEDK